MSCPDCNGTGRVQLLFSDVACDCQGPRDADFTPFDQSIEELEAEDLTVAKWQRANEEMRANAEQVRANLGLQGEINERKAQNRAVLDAFSERPPASDPAYWLGSPRTFLGMRAARLSDGGLLVIWRRVERLTWSAEMVTPSLISSHEIGEGCDEVLGCREALANFAAIMFRQAEALCGKR